MKNRIPINPKILKWARERAGYSIDQEIKKFSKFQDWEEGKSFPTYSQLSELAKRYNRPLAVFFFPSPPEEISIEKSLRAISETDVRTLPPRVRYLFRKAKAFQIYLKELFAEESYTQIEKLGWLKNHSNKPIIKLADDIRSVLDIPLGSQENWKNSDQAVEEWRTILAEKGIYIFKEAFKDDRVSGFCIYDELFPVIFLNNSLSKNRQIFTIFHELAHLILKQNYLDIFDERISKLEQQHPTHVEVKCNVFAANFLVPNESFQKYLSLDANNDSEIQKIAALYKVSNEVILRKLLTHRKITKDFYEHKIKEWKTNYQMKEDNNKNNQKTGGGQYKYNQLTYLGRPYFSIVLERYYQGKIDVERASEYLNINAKSFSSLEEEFLRKGASSDVHI